MSIEEFFQSLWVWLIDFLNQLIPKYILPNVQIIIQVVILLFVAYLAGRISKAVVVRILRVFGLRKASVQFGELRHPLLLGSVQQGVMNRACGLIPNW